MIVLVRAERGLALGIRTDALPVLAGALVVIGAAVARVLGLAGRPLQPQESALALEALALYRGTLESYSGGALVANLTALFFFLFGDHDGVARLASLLAGVGMVVLPLLARGLPAAWRVGASGLVGYSAVATLVSREGGVAAPLALFTALALIAGWNYWQGGETGWSVVAGIAAGLALAADRSATLTFLIMAAVLALLAGSVDASELLSGTWRRAALLATAAGVTSFLLGSTLLGTSPYGLQASLANLWRWSGDLQLVAPYRLLGVLLDDPALIVLAIVGGVLIWRHPDRATRVLVIWSLAQVGLALICSFPDLRYLALAVMPLALAGGAVADAVWSRRAALAHPPLWVAAALFALPIVFLFFSALQRAWSAEPLPWPVPLFAVAAFGFLALYASTILPPRQVAAALGLLGGAMLALAATRGQANLNYGDVQAGQSLLRTYVVRPSISEVRDAAIRWARAEPEAPIIVDERLHSLLAWELRDVPNARFQTITPDTRGTAIVGVDVPRPVLEGRSVRRVPVDESARLPSLLPRPAALLRWLASRELQEVSTPHAILLVH